MGKELGEYLKKCRIRAKKSQGQVAKELGYESAQYISNIERGVGYPPLESARKWFDAMGASYSKGVNIWVREFKQQMFEAMDE